MPAAVLFALALAPRQAQRDHEMARSPPPRRGGAGMLTGVVVIAAAMLVFAPNLVSAWLGRLIGDVWATALSAVIALFSGLFGAALR